MQVDKVISGGQTGADQGGLEVAKELGIATGGTAPPGYMTEGGPQPQLLKSFGLREIDYDPRTYPRRTVRNIGDSDGTALFLGSWAPGSRLTYNECMRQKKPVIVNPSSSELKGWIEEKGIRVLNVAGNRESRNPGIKNMVRDVLRGALS